MMVEQPDTPDTEEEEEEASSVTEVFPYILRMEPGNVVILDANELAEELGASAFSLTDEGGFFYLKDGEWLSFPVAGAKKPTKLKSV